MTPVNPPPKSLLSLFILTTTLLCAPSLLRAQYYYYEDAEGVVHVTDEPPRARGYRTINLREDSFRAAVRQIPRAELKKLISELASENDLDPLLVEAIVKTESDGDTNAVSNKGAQGLMQLMPKTAKAYGVNDPHDPKQNLRGGITHLRSLLTRYQGNIDLAAAAFNAGEPAVAKYKGVPPYPETVDYVRKVRKYYERLRETASLSATPDAIRPANYVKP